MRSILLAGVALACVGLTSCAAVNTALTTAAETPAGQLFCALDGTVFAIADAAVPGAVIVTGALAADVQADCSAAAAATGAKQGVPVSPPPSGTAPTVTIPAPIGSTTVAPTSSASTN